MNRYQQIVEIVKVLENSPNVDDYENFEEVTLEFESDDDVAANHELAAPFRKRLFERIANMVIFNKRSDVLSGMNGKWDAARLEKGFTFGGGGIEMIDLYPEKKFKYKFLAWVR
ncbi:hypothetical protein LCGC14_0364940 [marine sediment metagenome]|uniref:Uncharacterized protein n=1 Tax=marine sediment metagenome TaxID=412755 RepID=A0A0F9TPW7_9ZZZZ